MEQLENHAVKFQTYLEDNLPAHLDLLRQMVKINSFTANASGVNALGQMTAGLFKKLGFRAEFIQAANFLYGKHLVLTRNGRSASPHRPPPTIGLISHLDTVYPLAEEEENDFCWREIGQRIYGPGTYDIKGGTIMIYMALSALQTVDPDYFDSVNWVVLLNAAEESLVPDFGEICRTRLAENGIAALVFEGGEISPGSEIQRLVVARKGMARFRIEVEGKAAHAGTSHEHGANAILQMADVIRRVAGFTDYEQEITFNVGTIAGGTVINRVPHQASAFVEMRAFLPDVFNHGVDKMKALNDLSTVHSANGGFPCRVQVEVLGLWAPWAPNPTSRALVEMWRETGLSLGIQVGSEERGGLSDGNWTWQILPTIDGLGPVGGNAHCSERSADGAKEQEYILPASYTPRAMLNIMAIRKLIDGYYEEFEPIHAASTIF